MIPPTSIDGTDITGATIDGTDVTEITVDGDSVFSAQTLPVAYSNLIAWYPFDSAEYGGANADDVTAIIGGSGDDTAYDGTVNGATYQSSGGVTDINAGGNSGAFDFGGSGDNIETGGGTFAPDTICLWIKADVDINSSSSFMRLLGSVNQLTSIVTGSLSSNINGEAVSIFDNSGIKGWGGSYDANEWYHWAFVFDGQWEFYSDGVKQTSVDNDGFVNAFSADSHYIGRASFDTVSFDGTIDDVRFYNTDLSTSQISDIVSNTPHP